MTPPVAVNPSGGGGGGAAPPPRTKVLRKYSNKFEVENVADIESILADLGMSLTDFDPSIFHTEG